MEDIIAKNDLYRRLTLQLAQLKVPISSVWEPPAMGNVDVVMDAMFGFSFKGWRGGGKDAPFDAIIDFFGTEAGNNFPTPIVSIDIPSGWDVENGVPPNSKALRPDMLVSLTAPKLC